MAVKLRLARFGVKKGPFYRIVATERENPRDGRYLEIVGTYQPMVDPGKITLKEDKIKKWLAVGAQPTRVVRTMIIKTLPGLIEAREKHQIDRIKDARKKRKARLAAKGGKAKVAKASRTKKAEAK